MLNSGKDFNKLRMLKGMIAEFYAIPFYISDLDSKIASLHEKMSSIEAVQYGKEPSGNHVPNDEKLASYVDKVMNLEMQKQDKINRQKYIIAKLHISDLTSEERKVIDADFTSQTFSAACEKAGYSRSQFSRILNRAFDKMIQYI